MNIQRHIIGRTVLELDTRRLADVWSLQEDMSRLFQQQGVEEMARLFDELVGDEEVVRLDRVEVEIGSVDRRFLGDEFIHSLVTALRETLSDHLAERLVASAKTETITRESQASDWEVLLYFLRYGRLPWWWPSGDWQVWFPRWSAVMQSNTNWRQDLWELLRTNPATQQRLVEQLPETFLRELILKLQPLALSSNIENLEDFNQIARQQLGAILTRFPNQEQSLWLTALDQVLTSISATPKNNGEVLLYFLEYGRLPCGQPSTNWQAWLLCWETTIQTETEWQQPLQQLLRNNPTARLRLVTQLPEALRHQLILLLQPGWTIWHTLLAQAKLIMQSLNLSSSSFQELERQAWEILLAEIDTNNTSVRPFPAATWTRNWLAQIMQDWRLDKNLNQIATEQLLTSIDAVSGAQRSLWLTAFNQVQKSTANENSTSLPQYNKDTSKTDWQVLLYFLTSGHLPNEQGSEDLLNWLPRWSAVMQNETSWQQPLRQLLRNNVAAQQRLITQLPEDWRHQLVLQLQPTWTNWYNLLAQAKELIQSLKLSNDARFGFVKQAWLLLLAEIFCSDNSPSRDLPADTWTRNWLALLETSFGLKAIEGDITARNSILSTEEETTGLYVNQAGLVLLHPFLQFYLEAVGLLDGEYFRDEFAQQTAIYLLYYLATKQIDAPEYELVLPKLLCGWPLNQPVARGLDLPEAALNEGEQLLQTVIDYWEVLKSTSPDGLREGFLQRSGKLTHSGEGDNWKIQVEQQAIDILLGSLPWGLSMVKLPWMKEVLIVEWY